MNLDRLKEISTKVELACNDQIPLGVNLAWSSVTDNVEWSDIREALKFAVSSLESKVIKKAAKEVESDDATV